MPSATLFKGLSDCQEFFMIAKNILCDVWLAPPDLSHGERIYIRLDLVRPIFSLQSAYDRVIWFICC